MWKWRRNKIESIPVIAALSGSNGGIPIPIKVTQPIEVHHTVTRNIPRPTQMTIWVENGSGQRYNLGWIDMSYKHSAPLSVNPAMIFGAEYNMIPPMQFTLELNYDPRF